MSESEMSILKGFRNVNLIVSVSEHLRQRDRQADKHIYKQVKPIGFEAPRGGAYNNRKHLKLEAPCS